MIKQKTIFLSTLLLILILGTTSLGATVEDQNTSLDNRWLGKESMRNILEKLNIETTEEQIISNTYQFNEWFRTIEDETITIKNILFFKNTTTTDKLSWVIGNGSFSNTLDYIYMEPNGEMLRMSTFKNWTYNENDSITGVNKENITRYYISSNSVSSTVSGAYSQLPFSSTVEEINSDGILSAIPTYVVYAKTEEFGYKTYFLTSTYELVISEPQNPTESGDNSESGDVGDGTGGNTNYPNYNEKLDNIQTGIGNVNNNLENIQQNMPTSGDIAGATTQGNKDYWGNSEDLNGENQEELIEDKVDELIENVSGDLNKNEIFGILQTYENKLFGSFTGQQDFKIAWNDISYMGSVIIPKGEINFSKICRENETLGKVKTTVNIILGFLLLLNCIIYLYNLLLATLGIDNPYLYEKPEDKTSVTYSTNMNTGKTTETTTMRRKDGKTFKYRREI